MKTPIQLIKHRDLQQRYRSVYCNSLSDKEKREVQNHYQDLEAPTMGIRRF
jgi:hypothetical protein